MNSVKQMQALYDDLASQMAAQRKEQNDLGIEHARLRAQLISEPRPERAERERLERGIGAIERRGALLNRSMQLIADEMTAIINELGPARATLRTAKANLAYMEGAAGPEDPAIVSLGNKQIALETRRLRKLIGELEA